jgi:RNA polymerase sigma-70 factor (ECF subfamily)
MSAIVLVTPGIVWNEQHAPRRPCCSLWREGRISFIRDYRYVGYVTDDAELVLPGDAGSFGRGTGY